MRDQFRLFSLWTFPAHSPCFTVHFAARFNVVCVTMLLERALGLLPVNGACEALCFSAITTSTFQLG